MTLQKIFYEYLLLASDDTIEKRERTAKKCVELTEDYYKESSKELVEALKSVTEGYKHYSTLLNKHDWKRIHKAEKALENHLKKN